MGLAIQLDPPLGEHGLRPVEVRVYFNVPPRPLTLQPNMLEIGTVSPGSETGPFTVSISSPADGTVRIAQHDVPAGVNVTGLPETALPVSPRAERSRIQFSIRVAENASLKPEQFSLKVKPGELVTCDAIDSSGRPGQDDHRVALVEANHQFPVALVLVVADRPTSRVCRDILFCGIGFSKTNFLARLRCSDSCPEAHASTGRRGVSRRERQWPYLPNGRRCPWIARKCP